MAADAVWPRPQMDASRITWPSSREQRQLVARRPVRPAGREPRQQLLLAHRADPAGDALAARLVAEERGDPQERVDQVGASRRRPSRPRSRGSPGRPRLLEGERQVERVGSDEHAGRPAEQDRLRPRPVAARRRPGPAGRRASPRTRPRRRPAAATAARQAEELACPCDPGVPIAAKAAPPSATIAGTLTSVSTLLTAVGLPNRPDLDRERRLVARLAAPALDRVEERRLLAADVGAGAAPDLDVEGEARAQDVVAQVAGRAGVRRSHGPCARAASGYSPRR